MSAIPKGNLAIFGESDHEHSQMMKGAAQKRGSRRDVNLFSVLFVLIAACLGMISHWIDERSFMALLLAVAMAAGLAAVPAWSRWIDHLGALRMTLFAAMVGAMLVAQFAQSYRFFPFYLWAMYSHGPVREVVSHRELRATLADGTQRLLNPDRLFRHGMDYGISVWLERAEADPAGAAGVRFNRVLAAIAEAHARYGDGPSVKVIEVVRLFHPVRKWVGEVPPPEVVWRWEVDR